MFREDVGRYPTTLEGLQALRAATSESNGWGGPYLRKLVPKDPWNMDFVYVALAAPEEGFLLYSKGSDKLTRSGGNDKDDINSWDEGMSWRVYYDGKRKRGERSYGFFKNIICFCLPFIALVCLGLAILNWRK